MSRVSPIIIYGHWVVVCKINLIVLINVLLWCLVLKVGEIKHLWKKEYIENLCCLLLKLCFEAQNALKKNNKVYFKMQTIHWENKSFLALGIEPRAMCILTKCFTTEMHPSFLKHFILRQCLTKWLMQASNFCSSASQTDGIIDHNWKNCNIYRYTYIYIYGFYLNT